MVSEGAPRAGHGGVAARRRVDGGPAIPQRPRAVHAPARLITDGAFEERGGEMRFMPASTPTPERLTVVLAGPQGRRRGHRGRRPRHGPRARGLRGARARGPASGPAAGARDPAGADGDSVREHLHAATTVDGRDRKHLSWRSPTAACASSSKPPGAAGPPTPTCRRTGFLARLCALVPPHIHTTRYFGVFANRHHLRARILPPSCVLRPVRRARPSTPFAGPTGPVGRVSRAPAHDSGQPNASFTSAGCLRSSAAAQDCPPCVDAWPHRYSGLSRNSRLKPLNRDGSHAR